MGFSGRPPGLPASVSRSPSPKKGSLGRPGDRSLQHCILVFITQDVFNKEFVPIILARVT